MKTEAMTESVTTALSTLYSKLAAFIPNLIGTTIVLIAGYSVAKFIYFLIPKILENLGKFSCCDTCQNLNSAK